MPLPVHVSDLLREVIAGLETRRAAPLVALSRHWEALVGPELAGNARPAGLKGDLLLVDVANSVWMQELQFRKAELMERLNAGLPDVHIREIRFRIAPLCGL